MALRETRQIQQKESAADYTARSCLLLTFHGFSIVRCAATVVVIGVVAVGWLEAVALEELQRRRKEALAHLRRVENVQIKKARVVRVQQHVRHEAQPLHKVRL